MDRVFLPLTRKSFDDFCNGKLYEVRRMERQWTRKNVRTGRKITVSCGYSGARFDGHIGHVLTGSLSSIFRRIPFKEVEPRAKTAKEAVSMNKEVLGDVPEYIAFEIIQACST